MVIILSFWEGDGVLPLMTPVLLFERELAMVFVGGCRVPFLAWNCWRSQTGHH